VCCSVLQYVCCSVLRKKDLQLKGSYSFFSTTVYSMCVAVCCSVLREKDLKLKGSYSFFSATVSSVQYSLHSHYKTHWMSFRGSSMFPHKKALHSVTLLRKETCNFRHPITGRVLHSPMVFLIVHFPLSTKETYTQWLFCEKSPAVPISAPISGFTQSVCVRAHLRMFCMCNVNSDTSGNTKMVSNWSCFFFFWISQQSEDDLTWLSAVQCAVGNGILDVYIYIYKYDTYTSIYICAICVCYDTHTHICKPCMIWSGSLLCNALLEMVFEYVYTFL